MRIIRGSVAGGLQLLGWITFGSGSCRAREGRLVPMLKKRMPTPKTGPKGRCYELCHLAWRAGLVKRWHLMEDGTWSLQLRDGLARMDGLTVEECARFVAKALEVEGLELAWGPCWLGYREIVVARVEVAA